MILIAAIRALIFALWTVFAAALMVGARLLSFGRPSLWWPWRQWIFRLWARGALRMLNVQLTVRGDAPAPPFLLISNHLSYLDIVVFAATVNATFVSKQEVAHWPFFGPMVRLLGTIFIDRNRRRDVARVNRLIDETLGQGRAVIVFAEGTSSSGADVLPLRPSLLGPAVGGRYPVRYARLAYATDPGAADASVAVCWWGDATFLPHAWGLFHVWRTSALVQFGADVVESDNRKDLAATLHDRIRSLPVSPH
jgi:1-acyl-sn-glycerol-3-phosphate acyltransferase